ncbi:MAG: hypothetical protein IJN59_00230 [Oscillospiraceae bacterium]|nr:hypothetical protein [Oscillospiraceae bacterium]
MKKFVSVLLVACLLFAFSVVGFASEPPVQAAEFVDAFTRTLIMIDSYYVNDEDGAITDDLVAFLNSELEQYEWFTDADAIFTYGFLDENAGHLSEYAVDVKNANASLEQYIKDKNYTTVVDESVMLTAYFKVLLYFGEDVLSDEHLEENYDMTRIEAAIDDRNDGYDYIISVATNPPADAQETYDAFVQPFTDVLNDIYLCETGVHVCTEYVAVDANCHKTTCTFCSVGEITLEHTWGEYTANADGSKTAVCEFCDAINVIPGETVEPEENVFASLFEKIKSFFDSIIAFLQSIFNF